jgi:hypothetical protein
MPTSAPSPLSSFSCPSQNPSRRPAITGLSPSGSSAGDAKHTWWPRPILPDHEQPQVLLDAPLMCCKGRRGCGQYAAAATRGIPIYPRPTPSAAVVATRGSRRPGAGASLAAARATMEDEDRTGWPSSSCWRQCYPVGGLRRPPLHDLDPEHDDKVKVSSTNPSRPFPAPLRQSLLRLIQSLRKGRTRNNNEKER